MDNQITLKYQENESQEIRIEEPKIVYDKKWNVTDDNQLYFMQEYKDAMEIVNGILALNDTKSVESFNNRVLFVGQRGTGKTSVMKSFAESLDNAIKDNEKAFVRLPMVDPSHFDNNRNLLETVINSMYSEAEKLINNGSNNEDITAKKEQLITQFDVVIKSLKAILGIDNLSYTLEGLKEKSKALQMRDEMKKLVAQYIDFYKLVNKKNGNLYLVLMIDDIDMTVSHAHEMLEELWKYLRVEKLIILMSANLGQLFNEIREHYSKAVKETLKSSNQSLSIDVEDMANKYLLKLFPTSHRVRVEHNVNQLIHTKLEGIPKVDGELQNAVLTLIWRKTRLLFIPKDADSILHPIIPTNLRELMQFLDMLTSLDEMNESDNNLFGGTDDYGHCKKNVEKFKKYILHNWIPEHLSVDEESVFENIPTDITEINKHLINSINVIGTQHKKRLMSREVELDMIERNAEGVNIDRDIYTMVSPNDPKFVKANKISDIFNQPSNYSYGDLLLMIDKYETYFESGEDRKFTDAIKIYYTILLFETMFFKSNKVKYTVSINDSSSDSEMKDFTKKSIHRIIPIQKLIGGNVYYPNYFEIITDRHFNQKGPSFDAKRAFYHKIKLGSDATTAKNKITEECPLFSVLYYGDIRPDRYETMHIYDTTFDNNAKIDNDYYVTFDMLSIFNNMLNPWQTICRTENNQFIKGWVSRISNWSDTCTIGEEKIPNSILPFYSVDLMLSYLKRSYKAKDITDNNDNHEHKYDVDSFLTIEKDIDDNLKKYYSVTKEGDGEKSNNNDTGHTILKDIHDKYIEIINGRIYKNQTGKNSDLQTRFIISNTVRIIDPVSDFRDYAVSIILSKYDRGKKDRDGIIKGLHKISTVSEMYKYLVEELFVNEKREDEIRKKIQQCVRDRKAVEVYYNELWSMTSNKLSAIYDENCKKVYQEIFNSAVKYFIKEE